MTGKCELSPAVSEESSSPGGTAASCRVVLVQERTDFLEEARPYRLVIQDHMIAAVERQEARAGNSAGELAPRGERHRRIVHVVHHQGRNGDRKTSCRERVWSWVR